MEECSHLLYAYPDTRLLILLDNLINNYDLTEAEIAERLGYSVRHTQRLIRRCYGDCLKELRQKQMCQTAVWLLEKYPDIRTEQVALQSGFSGAQTLRRVFARRGMPSPETYRKKPMNGKEVQINETTRRLRQLRSRYTGIFRESQQF